MRGFIAQLVEHRTDIAEVMGSNPVEALIFFSLLISKDLERSRLAIIFMKKTTHLNLQYMFRSPNDHLQLKVELN